MPFHGSISDMIRQCMHEGGREQDQCIAIAYSTARAGKNHFSEPHEHPSELNARLVGRASEFVKCPIERAHGQRHYGRR